MPVVSGVNAAAVTPRKADGSVDEAVLAKYVSFLVENGIQGIAFNGATGEYPLTTAAELRRILTIAKTATAGRSKVICGVGAAGLKDTLERCAVAEETGADVLLLPLPLFFPYQQEDAVAFASATARATKLPVLLYNLPQFTSGYSTDTVLRLLQEHENIVGIKDSSGKLETLRAMTVRNDGSARIVGNDGVLVQAIHEKITDGVISGLAGVIPELIVRVCQAGPYELESAAASLSAFIKHIDPFPTPWGLKFVGAARGLFEGNFAQPVAPCRQSKAEELQKWFGEWWPTQVSGAVGVR